MLSVLKIHNIAIIENAEIEFSNGFNVMTGETGAGKSIILDSINAVLGFRTSRELIRTGEARADVSAFFCETGPFVSDKLAELGIPESPDGTLVISRTIFPDRNVCRVNGELANVAVLRELGSALISIHGQQDNRELLDPETHIFYIDAVAGNSALFDDYSEKYKKLSETDSLIKKLSQESESIARKTDMLAYQIDELEKAEIEPGEWAELTEEHEKMLNFEKIRNALFSAYNALDGDGEFCGAVSACSQALSELDSVSEYSKDLSELRDSAGDAYYVMRDVAASLRSLMDDDGYSQAEIEQVETRLDLLNKLSKKYGATEEEMLLFLENAEKELDELSFSDEKLEALRRARPALYEETLEAAEKLSGSRRAAAEKFSKDVCGELEFLDMPNVVFFAEFNKTPLGENGIDEVQFMISANVGEAPKPIAKIASGGELSRIMLALKTVIADKDRTGTMIFDEIDAGVSGRAAVKIAKKLKNISSCRQVICVTHLAQIAAAADSHYLIEKDALGGKTYTSVSLLDDGGRTGELARLTGYGETVTQAQIKNAEDMIASYKE